MALLINGVTTAERTFPPISIGGGGTLQCLPYTDPAHLPLIRRLEAVRKVREAIHHIAHRIANYAPANAAFARIPRGSSPLALGWTLHAVLAGKDIVICFDPNLAAQEAGASNVRGCVTGDQYLTISATGLSGRGRSVEATILHELAHLNGASNSRDVRDAENVLQRCRMGDQFVRGATG
jgi:hypothetical protein